MRVAGRMGARERERSWTSTWGGRDVFGEGVKDIIHSEGDWRRLQMEIASHGNESVEKERQTEMERQTYRQIEGGERHR